MTALYHDVTITTGGAASIVVQCDCGFHKNLGVTPAWTRVILTATRHMLGEPDNESET